jgi:hypothetical protein
MTVECRLAVRQPESSPTPAHAIPGKTRLVQLELGSASLFAKKKGTSGFFQSQLDTSERMDTIGGYEVVTEEDIPRPRHPARGLAQARRNGQPSGR